MRARWDCVLVDEFQDLNPLQYSVIRELGRDHRHVFAVGDDEQSIYSWAGADPTRLPALRRTTSASRSAITLRENRRCSREIFALARRLIEHNPTLFDEPKLLEAERESEFCVAAHAFADDEAERDVAGGRRPAATAPSTGSRGATSRCSIESTRSATELEAAFLTAGIPCRLASGRALVEDPIIAYVLAALQVIARPDDVHDDAFLDAALPKPLVDDARARLPAHVAHAARGARGDGARARPRARRRAPHPARLLLARQPPRARAPAHDA